MQNSPGIPLAALVVAIALAIITMLSVIAGVGGGIALNELQLGATAWALALSGLAAVQRLKRALFPLKSQHQEAIRKWHG